MIETVAISGYRSLRELVLPLQRLNVVTGANGSGKSSLYRALRLLGDAALNQVVASLAREGGLPSTFWAGPEQVARSVKEGEHPVEGTVRQRVAALKLGFSAETYGYSIELGYPAPGSSLFSLDPEIKRECIWHGGRYRRAAALVDRRRPIVTLAGGKNDESVMLTKNLSAFDSMLATIADPQRAPEMLAVREAIRGWRFYDGFRTDMTSPVRTPQVGTFTPVLHNDGTDLAGALETIVEIGDGEGLARTVEDAFPGSRLWIEEQHGRFVLQLQQNGLLRPLGGRGTFGWNAAVSVAGGGAADAASTGADGAERAGDEFASGFAAGAGAADCGGGGAGADSGGVARSVADSRAGGGGRVRAAASGEIVWGNGARGSDAIQHAAVGVAGALELAKGC